jgi:hypothetical protein
MLSGLSFRSDGHNQLHQKPNDNGIMYQYLHPPLTSGDAVSLSIFGGMPEKSVKLGYSSMRSDLDNIELL